MENTKETIIYKALTLFSDSGYEGVSMRDIASFVGIKASSIYNHFKSKEDETVEILGKHVKQFSDIYVKNSN